MYDIGIGILVFNPNDDSKHLERIGCCLSSIVNTVGNTNKSATIACVLNQTVIGDDKLCGTGPKTTALVNKLLKQAQCDVSITKRKISTSMNVNHYSYLQEFLHRNKKCNKVVIFADDYIVPSNWLNIIFNEFNRYKDADFIMPSSSYGAKSNLLVPFDVKPSWDCYKIEGSTVGIHGGVSIKDVDEIAQKLARKKTIRYIPPASFETTVFTDSFLNRFGYLYKNYFSIFYDTEYFAVACANGAKGYISRKSFIFHYGKGGTAARYKDRDEKYKGSPSEKYLLNDIKLYNKRNGGSIAPWWSEKSGKPAVDKPLGNKEIETLIMQNNFRDLFRRSQLLYRIVNKIYNIYIRHINR